MARGNDRVISNEGVVAQRCCANGDHVAMHARRGKINSVGKETCVANSDGVGHHINNGGDFTTATNAHAGKTQPCWPE